MVIGTDPVPSSTNPPPPAAVRRRRWRRILLSAIVAVVVGGAATAVIVYRHWKTHADYLSGYAGIYETQEWPADRPLFIGAHIQPTDPSTGHRRLELRHVTPQVTVNTAGARVRVLTCPVTDPHLGMGSGSTPSACASTQPFRPGTFDLGFPATEIIYEITPARTGTVRIEGADVSYCGSGRCGDQRAGAGMVIRVTNRTP